jgi:DNA-binding CsgD family transcriptional regulator
MVTLAAHPDDFWPDDIVPLNTAATARDMHALTFAFVGRLREAAAALEGAALSASGYFALAIAEATLGRPEAARAALRDFRDTFPATNPRLIGQSLRFEEMYVTLPYHADDAPAVRQVTAELEERLGKTVLGIPPRMIRMPMLIIQGGWDEAWSYVPLVRRSARTTQAEMRGLTLVGMLARARGERAVVREMVAEMFPEGAGHEPGTLPFRYGLALQETAAALALDDEDLSAAKGWLDAHDRWLAWSGAVLGQSEGQALWAQYHRQAGDLEQACMHAERALVHAATPRQPLALLAAHRLRGELATDAARFADAQSDLDTAFALADACEAPYERALTLLALATLRLATGDTQRARTLLEDARTICARLGATPALARADALLAHLSPTSPAVYPAGLSAREVEVLRLVAQGWTDRQVADHLFLSPRTVSQHLRSIYNKLGVSTRAAATHFAVEQGIA